MKDVCRAAILLFLITTPLVVQGQNRFVRQFGIEPYGFVYSSHIDENGKTIVISNDYNYTGHITLLDENGMIEWNYDHPFDSSYWVCFGGVIKVHDLYIISGIESGIGFLLALDTLGQIAWNVQLDPAVSSVNITHDADYIYALGALNSSTCLMKFDLGGSLRWARQFFSPQGGGHGAICFSSVLNQIVFTFLAGTYTTGMCFADTAGNAIRNVLHPIFWCWNIIPNGDKGFVLGGMLPPCGQTYTLIIKTDLQGTPLIEMSFETGALSMGPSAMWVNQHEEIYLGTSGQGNYFSPTPLQVGLGKISATGNLIWCKALHAGSSADAGIHGIRELADGSIVIMGLLRQNGMNLCVARQDTSATLDCISTSSWAVGQSWQPALYTDTIYSVLCTVATTYSNFILNPSIVAQGFYCTTGIEDNFAVKDRITIYPNPTADYMIVENPGTSEAILTVYSMMGQRVIEQQLSPGENRIQLSEEMADGVYKMRLENEGVISIGELTIVR